MLDESLIKFIDDLLTDAITKKISDIHIEPYADHCRIRFRRDGLLYITNTLPTQLTPRLTTRIKIMANLNIAERRLPQDGRLSFTTKHPIDIRISTCPTLHGEKIVLRLLPTFQQSLAITDLGMTKEQVNLFTKKLSQPQGLILVTGPTGSGKTRTLYSALSHLNQPEKNIASVEDPVEIELPGINQINVRPKIALDFAHVLRALLRQDPDILMIGEIRDLETAKIATQAAQTGHLVLSTLHTNNVLESLSRLQLMGIEPYQLAHSLSLIIAQRLIRTRCQCYSFSGCPHCYQGYLGRTGIFEVIPLTATLIQCLLQNEIAVFEKYIQEERLPTLLESANLKLLAGNTTQEEILRVLGYV